MSLNNLILLLCSTYTAFVTGTCKAFEAAHYIKYDKETYSQEEIKNNNFPYF